MPRTGKLLFIFVEWFHWSKFKFYPDGSEFARSKVWPV